MISQFDAHAVMYEEFSALPFRQELEFPSVLGQVGDVDGRSVLDLGCGSGVYSRMLSEYGAGQVVGLDESEGMLSYARRREQSERRGIRYVAGAMPEDLLAAFDVVLGVYVLPYATTYAELAALCRTAADALRPGGRFVTLPIHPDFHPDPDHYADYGFRLYAERARQDGAPVGLDLRFGDYDAHIVARYWSAATLERALTEAGFASLHWQVHRLSAHAAAGPADFWQAYMNCPHAAIITAVRAGGTE